MPAESLDLSLVQKLESLELRARYVVEGFLTGLNRSPLRGFSAEFAEYRHYFPGDPLKLIDWKLFGRSDRIYVKQFEEQTNLQCHLVLDVSGSMEFRSRASLMSKMDYARTIAAALAMFLHRQRDNVGLTLCQTDGISYQPSQGGTLHLQQILGQLGTTHGEGELNFGLGIQKLANLLNRRSFIVLISDFYEDTELLEPALQRLRYDHHEVIAFQILDPMEANFKYTESTLFHDMETGNRLVIDPQAMRKTYQAEFQAHQSKVDKVMRDYEVDLTRLRTDASLEGALSAYLAKREGKL